MSHFDCNACNEAYDHSIHKPSVLICGHSFCLKCLKKLNKKECPTCKITFEQIIPNRDLLHFISESNNDNKLKAECDICINPFDHSIHRPTVLACGHTFCLTCLKKLNANQTCYSCNKAYIEMNTNIALLKMIPESNYDKLKAKTLKGLIEINEALKQQQDNHKIMFDEKKLITIKKLVGGNNKREAIENNMLNEEKLNCFIKQISAVKVWIQEFKLEKVKKDKEKFENEGNHLFELEKYIEAIKCLNKVIELDTNNSKAYYNKGFALSKLKKHDKALGCFDKVIELDSDNLLVFNEKALTLMSLNKHEEAIQFFDISIERKPLDSLPYYNKANALSDLKRYDEAMICLNKSIELNPKLSNLNSDFIRYMSLNKFKDAIDSMNKSIKLDLKDSRGYNNKGIALNSQFNCFSSKVALTYNDFKLKLISVKLAVECFQTAFNLDSNDLFLKNKQDAENNRQV